MPNGYIKSKTGTPVELVDAWAREQIASRPQADWESLDSDSPSYIQNKPFGHVKNTVEVTDLSYNSDEGIYFAPLADIVLVEGATYTVTVGGESHDLVAEMVGKNPMLQGMSSPDYIFVGNKSLLEELGLPVDENVGDDSVSYAIVYTGDSSMFVSHTDSINTVAITGVAIKQIDVQYIPELDYANSSDIYMSYKKTIPAKTVVRYKDFTTNAAYDSLIWVVSERGLWLVWWSASSNDFATSNYYSGIKVTIDTTTGTITSSFQNDPTDIPDTYVKFTAYRYDTDTGSIVERINKVTEVTIGKIDTKKISRTIPAMVDNKWDSQPRFNYNFNEYVDKSTIPTDDHINELIDAKIPDSTVVDILDYENSDLSDENALYSLYTPEELMTMLQSGKLLTMMGILLSFGGMLGTNLNLVASGFNFFMELAVSQDKHVTMGERYELPTVDYVNDILDERLGAIENGTY